MEKRGKESLKAQLASKFGGGAIAKQAAQRVSGAERSWCVAFCVCYCACPLLWCTSLSL